MKKKIIGIIGGGFIGAVTAIHLARYSKTPLKIIIIEPNKTIAHGVAFSTQDDDHRLNGPSNIQFLYPEDIDSFTKWIESSGTLLKDLNAEINDGRIYARRRDFGKYVEHELFNHTTKNASNSIISHYQDIAVSISQNKNAWDIKFKQLNGIRVDKVIITPCNFIPSIPKELTSIARHQSFIANPWSYNFLYKIKPDARVLIIGTGLTMADIAITLLRDNERNNITAISRRGLLPQRQRQTPPREPIWDALMRPIPQFIESHGLQNSVFEIFRIFRKNVAELKEKNIEWQVAFDDVRDAAYKLWPSLSLKEKEKYFRHLSSWYESHRFRLPPQTAQKLDDYKQQGKINYYAGSIIRVEVKNNFIQIHLRLRHNQEIVIENFDNVINCTGPERDPRKINNPIFAQLIDDGYATPSPFGMGFEVNNKYQSISLDKSPIKGLFFLGPLTRNAFGEINGIPTLIKQIYTAVKYISQN